MNIEYIRNRITELRMKKGVSEHRMSLDLGHCRSYIHGITAGKSLPSLTEFLYICEYLGVTPELFFSQTNDKPVFVSKLIAEAQTLTEEDFLMILNLVKRLNK